MSKHTDGPWFVYLPDGPGEHRPGIEGVDTVVVYGLKNDDDAGVYGRDDEEAMANANLISAAPELLDALRDIDSRLRDCMTAPGMSMITVADAYDSFYQEIVAAAIAKALGAKP